MFQTINPYTQEVLATYQYADQATIEKTLETATLAQSSWQRKSFTERGELFTRLAQLLKGTAFRLATLIAKEMGKPIKEARAEILKCAWACDYYALNAEKLLAEEELKSDAAHSYLRYEPLGTILGIMPWNFPFWQVFRFVVPSLMAGNVAIIKHAPNTTGCGEEIADLFVAAGFPKGILQHLILDNEQVATLIANPQIHAVTLTGSETAGSSVAATAGKHLKKTVLELGGSDAFIVLEDADMELAVTTAVQSRMQNAGQSCIAAKRFLVAKNIKNTFIEALKPKLWALKFGNPLNEETEVGVIARQDLLEKLHLQVQTSIRKGAVLELGGFIHENFYAPTILSNVTAGMPAFDEELFGGVFAITTFENEQEAVTLTNQSKYGLAASIWSKDTTKASFLAKQLKVGAVFINALVRSDPRLPFGGIKNSGYGRELSYFGLKEFCNVKTIYVG
jgi:succinate-semialdehyde dehydrogenase/glutarate-semialdehyde dehydrogenase